MRHGIPLAFAQLWARNELTASGSRCNAAMRENRPHDVLRVAARRTALPGLAASVSGGEVRWKGLSDLGSPAGMLRGLMVEKDMKTS